MKKVTTEKNAITFKEEGKLRYRPLFLQLRMRFIKAPYRSFTLSLRGALNVIKTQLHTAVGVGSALLSHLSQISKQTTKLYRREDKF